MVLVAGVMVGTGSAFWVLKSNAILGSTSHSGWVSNDKIGLTSADPYTRAVIAQIGLLAMNRSEAQYYTRYTDELGKPLKEECDYELRGGTIPARWWSITIYAEDNFLPVNGSDAMSIDADTVTIDETGGWVVLVANKERADADWLSSQNAGRFSLSLRLYNPDAGLPENTSETFLPSIMTMNCGRASK